MSPRLQGGFLTIGLPGKSLLYSFVSFKYYIKTLLLATKFWGALFNSALRWVSHPSPGLTWKGCLYIREICLGTTLSFPSAPGKTWELKTFLRGKRETWWGTPKEAGAGKPSRETGLWSQFLAVSGNYNDPVKLRDASSRAPRPQLRSD